MVIIGLAACGQVVDNSNKPDATQGQLPGVPTALSAMANVDLGARLSWTAPASESPITSYTVTASPAGGTTKIVGTNAIVTGLTVGTQYTFTVAATNDAGTGPASDPSSAVTIVAGPAAPTKLSACGANASAVIRAAPPATGTTYNLYSDTQPGASKLSMKQANVMVPFTHMGLTNGTKQYYVLTAVDSNGIESADSAEDSTTPDAAVHDSAFAGSFSQGFNAIEIMDCVSKQGMTGVGFGRAIRGPATMIAQTNYNNIAVDAAHERVFVRQANQVLVWDNATTVNGNVAPTRIIASGSITPARGLAYDPQRDILYVSNGPDVLVLPGASTLNGTVTTQRDIVVPNGGVNAIAIDVANDRIYLANTGVIHVYNSASTANGSVAPTRTFNISSGSTVSSFGITYDAANDTVYASSRNENRIYAIANASNANGTVVPTRTITPPPALALQPMGLSFAGTKLAHFSDSATRVQIWDAANTVDGMVAPTQDLQFPTLSAGASIVYVP